MCVSNQVEQFSASYSRWAVSAPQAAEAREATGPKGRTEQSSSLLGFDIVIECAQTRTLDGGGLGVGGDGGRHDRTPSSLLKARATSALGLL